MKSKIEKNVSETISISMFTALGFGITGSRRIYGTKMGTKEANDLQKDEGVVCSRTCGVHRVCSGCKECPCSSRIQ